MKRALWLRLFALAALLTLLAPLSPAQADPPAAETAQSETLAAPDLAAQQFCFAADTPCCLSIPDYFNPYCGSVSRVITLNCPTANGKTITNIILSANITHPCAGEVQFQLAHNAQWTYFYPGSLPCAAATPQSWSTSFFNGAPVNGVYVLYVFDCGSGGVGSLDSWSIKVEYNNTPPAVLSAAPASGLACPGAVQTFQSVFEDADGLSDIDTVELLFDEGDLAKANHVYLQYSRRLNQLSMRNLAHSAWLGGFAPGQNQVIETSLARLYVQDTTVSAVGNQLTVNWAVEFLPPNAGKVYRQMLYAADLHGGFSGWENMGHWTVSCDPLGEVTRRIYLPLLSKVESPL